MFVTFLSHSLAIHIHQITHGDAHCLPSHSQAAEIRWIIWVLKWKPVAEQNMTMSKRKKENIKQKTVHFALVWNREWENSSAENWKFSKMCLSSNKTLGNERRCCAWANILCNNVCDEQPKQMKNMTFRRVFSFSFWNETAREKLPAFSFDLSSFEQS